MLTYYRYPDQSLTVFVASGNTPLTEWLEKLKVYMEEGASLLELYDFRREETDFSSDDVRQINHLRQTLTDRPRRPVSGKTALVVRDALQYGLCRVYHILTELDGVEWEVRIFEGIDPAAAWLGIDAALINEAVGGGDTR